jgi:hypothetical protein
MSIHGLFFTLLTVLLLFIFKYYCFMTYYFLGILKVGERLPQNIYQNSTYIMHDGCINDFTVAIWRVKSVKKP